MPTVLYDDGVHKNVLFEEDEGNGTVPASQHLIIHGDEAIILDPGGPIALKTLFPETKTLLGDAKLKHILLSHQCPDIVATINTWLVRTNATAHLSELWGRFVPHFALNRLMDESLELLADEGGALDIGGCTLQVLPAHFLHSVGNFHVYDPIAKILYTGDLCASIEAPYQEATDLESHLEAMRPFHERYMASNLALADWAARARALDIDILAPQHGAFMRGDLVAPVIDWLADLKCGVDLIESFELPTKRLPSAGA